MVTPGHATSRAYEVLRQRIVSLQMKPGDRVDPAWVADELGSSVTPVRDGLHILAGEGLIEIRPGEGYYVARTDEAVLRDLYEWNLDLIMAALRRGEVLAIVLPEPVDDAAVGVSALFAAIARASSNKVHGIAMRWANARLGPARRIECRDLFDCRTELSHLRDAVAAGDAKSLRKLISAYHADRRRMVRKIAMALAGERGGEADI
ncbi:regulatory protein, gntR family [Sphingobium sp. YR657]|uniref:GntR family transcriptional regulator n=1 Tax=Sphingobium sp. YR657 TaxID=1884366 RepID=UPI00091D80EF|nr:GntR family transcriptional regulator [Sphingobium sp. YR657]SHL51793.1 regulatory protein, gntR family [Sphingobium sp. YR657]